MSDNLAGGDTLEEAVQSAKDSLQAVAQNTFTDVAFNAFQDQVSSYIRELFNESFNAARRERVDAVSVVHVERAAEFLGVRRSRRFVRHLGSIGGLLWGSGVAVAVPMFSAGSFTPAMVLVAFVPLICGAVALALHWVHD